MGKTSLVFAYLFAFLAIASLVEANEQISSVRVESCPGCSLNRLPEVKSFIYDDLPKYKNVEFKRVHGAPPEMVFLNGDNVETKRVPLSKLTRAECNGLLISNGFNQQNDDEL